MKATRRSSAPRSSAIATIPDAPPATMPSDAVARSTGAVRARRTPATMVIASVAALTSTTGTQRAPSSVSVEVCRYVPTATPATAWPAGKSQPGSSSPPGTTRANAMPTRIAANRKLDGTPIRSAAKPAAAVTATASASLSGDASGRRFEAIVARVEVADATPEVEREVRPHDGIAAVRVEVPASATAGVPHGAGEPPLEVVVPLVLHLRLDLENRPAARRVHGGERLHHVADLRLEHVHDRGVAEVQVRSPEHEQVGEAGDGGAEVCLRAALPVLRHRAPVRPAQDVRDRRVGRREAGGEDDRVELARGAVGGPDRVPLYALDPVRHDLRVRGGDRRIPVARQQHALAPDRVVRRQLLAELRVLHLVTQLRLGDRLLQLEEPRVHDEAEHHRLAHPVDRGSRQLLDHG